MRTREKKTKTVGVSFDKQYNRRSLSKALDITVAKLNDLVNYHVSPEEGINTPFTSARLKMIYGVYCNERFYNPTSIRVVFHKKKTLEELLGMNRYQFDKMIEPHLLDIGERPGHYYNLHQVRMIIGIYYMQKQQQAEERAAA